MTREEMLINVIKSCGFEAKDTIHFSQMCENPTISTEELFARMTAIINKPFEEEDW